VSSISPELRVIHDRELKSAAMNMAVDEALLLAAKTTVLRFYGWQRPSLSFGYFGRASEALAEGSDRELVRRWTGGGIVLHGADLTYSIIIPRVPDRILPSPRELYEAVHGAIREALGDPEVELADGAAPKVSEACFANAVAADVMVDGRKIAGAAQRRTRAGLLHQGSIQYDKLPVDFEVRLAGLLCPHLKAGSIGPEVLESAKALATQKYGRDAWLHQR
jgi:lipoate-protein ligase A